MIVPASKPAKHGFPDTNPVQARLHTLPPTRQGWAVAQAYMKTSCALMQSALNVVAVCTQLNPMTPLLVSNHFLLFRQPDPLQLVADFGASLV